MQRTLFFVTILLLTLSGQLRAQPGDFCASAIVIPTAPFNQNVQVMTFGDNCPLGPRNDWFFSFTASVSGTYTAQTCDIANGRPMSIRAWSVGTCCAGTSVTDNGVCGADQDTLFITAGQTVIFEIGHQVDFPVFSIYTFSLSAPIPPPCGGTLTLPVQEIAFAPTTLGGTTAVQLLLENSSALRDLCVSDIRTNGSIWTVTPTTFTIPPNGQQQIEIAFSPTFAHDFLGTIEILSSDAANSLDSILVEGTGGRAVIMPPAPVLSDANSPRAVYFHAPWVQANPDQEYCVAYSEPGGQLLYADWPRGSSDTPVWKTSAEWAKGSDLTIEDTRDSDYEVGFAARDLTGTIVFGPNALWAFEPEAIVFNPDLTIKSVTVMPPRLLLDWDDICKAQDERRLQNFGWGIYQGDNLDAIDELIDIAQESPYEFELPANTVKFFAVDAIAAEIFVGPQCFIAWPPDGVTLAGVQEVILKDALHYAEWDSFRIEWDSAGTSVLLGSNWDNTMTIPNQRGCLVDFNRLGNGPQTITAIIVDHEAHIATDDISVTVVDEPFATFDATFDDVHLHFDLTETGTVIPSGFTQAGTLWLCSHVGERYGSNSQIPWEPAFDSLMLVMALPQLNEGLLHDETYMQHSPSDFGGVQPSTTQTPVRWSYIQCCCISMNLNSSGQSEGTYDGAKRNLGAIANCDARAKTFAIGFAFEVELTLGYIASETGGDCSWGQDAKGTRVFSTGTCKNATDACVAAKTDTITKKHNGVNYPFTGDTGGGFGNDGHGPKTGGSVGGRNRGYRDQSGLPGKDKVKKAGKAEGTTRWWDWPAEFGSLANRQCVRDHAQNSFFAVAEPPCNSEMPCCLMWNIEWDVTICMKQNGCVVTQTTPPTLTPITPAGGCPALAP